MTKIQIPDAGSGPPHFPGAAVFSERPLRIGITMGDPAGIGPEIIIKALQKMHLATAGESADLIVVGSGACLRAAAQSLGHNVEWVNSAQRKVWPRVSLVEASPDRSIAPATPGRMDAAYGRLAFEAIDCAVQMALRDELDAIVTAPINKEALNAAGFHYAGHTEILRDLTHSDDTCMLLVHGPLRVSHVTTHLALKDVPARITRPRVERVVTMTRQALQDFGVDDPHIAVCGLNPHAGEGGLFGGEEDNILAPLIRDLQASGLRVSGPYPGDTVFVRARAGHFDAVVAMYHDQGHIPVKLLGFTIDPSSGSWNAVNGVNVTLGTPLIRTSVDHGTAFDIAGRGTANAQSMIEAIALAVQMADHRRQRSGNVKPLQ